MQHKRILAVAVAATMLIGSTVTAFADDATGATGTGTSFDHVNKEITSVKLPTTSEVANVFNYYVDPERLINDAGTLADGTTTVAGNDDGVYFSNAAGASTTTYAKKDEAPADYEGNDFDDLPDAPSAEEYAELTEAQQACYDVTTTAGTAGYSSKSDAVSFEGRNSVAVDVSVKAEIKETDAKQTDIALVADANALAAATTPALLMQIKVGNDTKAITSAGTTATATIAGKEDNFEVTTADGKYVYQAKSDATGWNSTTVQLIGKTNEKDVPTGTGAMTAPKITLTWTVAAHADAYVSSTTVSTSGVTLNMPTGVSISSVVLNKASDNNVTLESGNTYTVSGTKLTIKEAIINAYPGKTITVTYSDSHSDVLTIS